MRQVGHRAKMIAGSVKKYLIGAAWCGHVAAGKAAASRAAKRILSSPPERRNRPWELYNNGDLLGPIEEVSYAECVRALIAPQAKGHSETSLVASGKSDPTDKAGNSAVDRTTDNTDHHVAPTLRAPPPSLPTPRTPMPRSSAANKACSSGPFRIRVITSLGTALTEAWGGGGAGALGAKRNARPCACKMM